MSASKDTIYNIVGAASPLILALVTIPLYIEAVGIERYGALAIAWLILGYFGLFDLGLGRATAQRIAKSHTAGKLRLASIFWTATIVNLFIGAIGGGILFFVADIFFGDYFQADQSLVDEAIGVVPWLAAAVPVATLTGVASGALQGRKLFLDLNISTLIGGILFQLLPLAVAWWVSPNLEALVFAAIAARLIGLVVFLQRVHIHLLRGFVPTFNQKECLILLKFGGWVACISAVSPLLVVLDRFFIGAIMTAVAVAIYTVPFEMVQRTSIIPRSIAMALFPRMAEAESGQSLRFAERSSVVVAIVITPVVLVMFFVMRPFLTLWIGAEIAQTAGPVAIMLLLGYWVNALAIIPFSHLQAIGRPKVVAFILLAQIPFYIASLYYCISHFGLLGAASIFSLRALIDFILLRWFSLGSWSLQPLIVAHGILVGSSAVANFFLDVFSLLWWAAALATLIALVLLLVRFLPRELSRFVDEFAPSYVSRLIRYV